MFAKARRHRDSTASTPTSANPTPVSPLQQDFDFGLQSLGSPVSIASDPFRPSTDSARPRTVDRPASRRSIVSLQPPVLPPIPRVASASRHDRNETSTSRDYRRQETEERTGKRDGGDETSTPSNMSTSGSNWDFNPSFDWQDFSSMERQEAQDGQTQAQSQIHHAPSQSLLDINFDTPIMEASMFPRPEVSTPGNTYNNGPAMSRSFIDSRDKPYAQTAHRPPPIHSSYSSPDMLSPRSPATFQGANGRSPLLPGSAMSGSSKLNPHSATSPRDTRKSPSVAPTDYSGSTARPSTQSSASTATSPLQHQTIGTPYQETSPSFPAPQHVATRPRTTGSSSTIAGVMVPTHHTSGQSLDKGKSEKRKTRLLNPMALLVRRRSAQDPVVVPDDEELRLRAQAQARQKRVATIGVNPMPEDFDPRIRGKVVHDFSAPRPQRNFSYSDAERRPSEQMQSTNSMPLISLPLQDSRLEQPPQHSQQPSDVSSRNSRHMPIFVEHLHDDLDTHRRMSSVQAEQLENRDFLNRASHQSSYSAFSQESSTLPPFARRSQQIDPMQASFYRDDESKRSSDPSSSNERNSDASSTGFVSPVAARASDNSAVAPRSSMTPISPESPRMEQRAPLDPPKSDSEYPKTYGHAQIHEPNGSKLAPVAAAIHSPDAKSDETSVGNTTISLPNYENAAQEATAAPPRISRDAPGTLVLPPRDVATNPSPMSSPRFDSSAASTPEPATFGTAVAVKSSSSPPRLVEKRASAVGHSKRLSAVPKHQASNASRFSFQMGESAAEERILEEKHRKMAATGKYAAQAQQAGIPDEDDEDYFDEDAMDDEDEMELMQHEPDMEPPAPSGRPGVYLSPPKEEMPDSDDGSVYDEEIPEINHERDVTYAMHPAFRTHSAMQSTGENSAQPSLHRSSGLDEYMNEGYNPHHQSYLSDASMMSSGNGNGNGAFLQDNLSPSDSAPGTGKPRSDFYMQPQAAGYSSSASPLEEKQPNLPPIRSNDQASKPKEALGSPMSITSGGTVPSRGSAMSASTMQSAVSSDREPRTAATTSSPEPSKQPSNGLGLSGFSDFVFTDGPDLSLGNSPATSPQNLSRPDTAANRNTVDSVTLPNYGQWNAANQYPTKPLQPAQQSDYARQDYRCQDDDMYFDDGGFDEDVQNPNQTRGVNESDFDRPDFLGGFRGMEPRGHQHTMSAMSISSDGPYPTFAIPNPAKARQRDSRMLLEDLPLQTAVDPRWIPQRNPSEDAKRLGLSTKVPPLPAQPGSFDSMQQAQQSLLNYHQALADAANRAAFEGRFIRQPSVATTARSVSLYSLREDTNDAQDDHSHYSYDADYDEADPANAFQEQEHNAAPTDAIVPQEPQIPQHRSKPSITTPSRLHFDFGFNDPSNDAPQDFDDYASDLDDSYMNDEDVIAAANAEALANDTDGFYGQEFGFYAKARPTSSHSKDNISTEQAQAINGGYFGIAGDDGLARNKSLQEPNLTPITERSEFSTRNSYISSAHFGPPSAGPWGGGLASPGLARLPISPLATEGVDGAGWDQLRKARAGAFGGGGSAASSPVQRLSGGLGYFGSFPAPAPVSVGAAGVRTPGGGFAGESPSSRDSPARGGWHDSPSSASAASGKAMPFSTLRAANGNVDCEFPLRKPAVQMQEPTTAKKAPVPGSGAPANGGHSRQDSDSVAYVREQDPASPGQPRWVLERRRTSELGTELVGREVVKGGWI